ncbi:MAG: T9SS type A sorting domain-containing protein [Bacteroidetes bacterium]|nr:T9SS type A sorting domain-containing protein [Bacteroidota bacterium]
MPVHLSPRRWVCLTALAVLLGAGPASGQDQSVLARKETTASIRTVPSVMGRVDMETKVTRAWYDPQKTYGEVRPQEFLRRAAQEGKWSTTLDDLRLVSESRRARSGHQTWEQIFRGIPVSGRTVKVNTDASGGVTFVTSAFEPVQADPAAFDIVPRRSADQAAQAALQSLAEGAGAHSTPRLVVHDPSRPILAWELVVWPHQEPAEYRVVVDAMNGEVISWMDVALAKHDPRQSRSRTDGSGYVFDPDPLFVSGAAYGPPYVDDDDATNPALDAVRKVVTLPGISQNPEGKWVLEGPYVRIVGRNTSGTEVYAPPAMDGPDDFFFFRADDRFEAVNAYYHIDRNQRYVQSLGFDDLQQNGVDVNPQGLTRDDSFYFPDRNLIMFGTGGVDDAEDPSVLIHEYGHALLNAAAPGLLAFLEGRALHEGFSDYWQASYYRHLVETGQASRTDWRWVFLWDSGEGSLWSGRYLDHAGIYPQDVCVTTGSGSCSIHDDGRMWATTLMEVWDELGRDLTDRLVLHSHYYLEGASTFADAARAVVQADLDYFDGTHADVLIRIFSARGLVDAGTYGPLVDHEPLLSTELSGTAIPVTATVRGISASVAEVELVYYGRTFAQTVVSMVADPGQPEVFNGELHLPAQMDTVFYYLRARDQSGNETVEPATAPTVPHHFVVGLDTEAPFLEHDPPAEVTFLAWPPLLSGVAQDNFGVASIRFFWYVLDPDGVELATGSAEIGQGNGAFSVEFPVPLSLIEHGSQVRYYLEAEDASARRNTTRYPSTGHVERSVDAGSVLHRFGFEGAESGVAASGVWALGAPAFGMQVTPEGSRVAATRPDAAYPADPGLSTLALPAINLARVDPVKLRFWHFFDTEHTGPMDPAGLNGILFDGGRLEVRTNGLPEWRPLVPEGGYPGRIAMDRQNPLAGADAWGGFSHGWRRVSVPLPQEDGVQVRFVFGTDTGNSGQSVRFVGWMIDALELVTGAEVDTDAPEVTTAPPAERIESTTAAPADISIRALDDLGIQDVWLEWSLGGDVPPSAVRMTQHADNLTRFSATTDFLVGRQPGDVLTYTIRVVDPTGKDVVIGPFLITFRLFGSHEALSSVWASGSWEPLQAGWIFRTEDASAQSGLILDPRDTESNALDLALFLDHEITFGAGAAGLLEVSDDDGASWKPLEPEGGYPGTAGVEGGSPLQGRAAFTGSRLRRQDRFDLTDFAGDQVQVRLLAASDGGGSASQYWRLFGVSFRSQTEDQAFESDPEFELQPAFPNPFSGQTRLALSVPEAGRVTLRIYDALGREVATLIDGMLEAGSHGVTFDAPGLPSGVYYARLQAGGRQAVQTLVHSGR